MAPPPHPIRSVDFYRREDNTLGIAYVATGDSYMDAVAPEMTPGAINLQPVDEYLNDHFGTKIGKDHEGFFRSLGFVEPNKSLWPLPREPSLSLKEWELTASRTGSLLTDLS